MRYVRNRNKGQLVNAIQFFLFNFVMSGEQRGCARDKTFFLRSEVEGFLAKKCCTEHC